MLVARSPHELFIDPSHTYRLRFSEKVFAWAADRESRSFPRVPARRRGDEPRLRALRDGDRTDERIWDNHAGNDSVTYLVAVRDNDGAVVGTVTGVDHERLFDDPERGSSLWSLAVDPAAGLPGRADPGARRALPMPGRAYMDLSVVHDNAAAIALYEKLGFQRVPVLCIKRKNAINEPLFTASHRRPSTTSTPTPGSSPTRRCGAASRSRFSTPRPASCGSPTADALPGGADRTAGARRRPAPRGDRRQGRRHRDPQVGTGQHSVLDLIEAESRRRAAATGGESHIPLDDVTEGTVREGGLVV